MRIDVYTLTEKGFENLDYRDYLRIDVNGKQRVSFLDGEPEDNNLGRNFNDCYTIPFLMEMSFKAASRGEDFEIVDHKVDEIP